MAKSQSSRKLMDLKLDKTILSSKYPCRIYSKLKSYIREGGKILYREILSMHSYLRLYKINKNKNQS